MSVLFLASTDPGAPALSGTNGSLCSVLDWALVQAGWAVEYTSTNARVYRPGTGNRYRLLVDHDSANSTDARAAVVRGCEDATSTTTLVNPFPITSQRANSTSNWLVSITASATAREYRILLTETFVAIFVNISSTGSWELGMYGDVPSSVSGDIYNTICYVRGSSTYTSNTAMVSSTDNVCAFMPNAGTPRLFWCRDASGATLSSIGIFYGSCNTGTTGSGFCDVVRAPTCRSGYANKIYREYLGVSDLASATTTPSTLAQVKRGWAPNLWNPIHSSAGTVGTLDTFGDTAYDPAASFTAICSGTSAAARMLIVETTDTWSAP